MGLFIRRGCLASALFALLIPAVRAEADRPVVAKCGTVSGALLRQQADQPWQPIKAGTTLHAGESLIALPLAEVLSANGGVELLMAADIGQRGPFPVLESAVMLGAPIGVDLTVTLERGVIALTNRKETGAAKVRIRFRGETWELTLREPGAKVGLELYARYPPGLPQLVEGKVGEPTTEVLILALQGSAFVDTPEQGYGLRAPPGPALLHWDTVSREPQLQRLEKLPEGLKPRDAKEQKEFDAVCASARRLTDRPLDTALDDLLKSQDAIDRLTGVTAAAAVDDLLRLRDALADPLHADTRDQAVLVARHWIGRDSRQLAKLLNAMKEAGLSEVRARTVLQLLFGFDDEQRQQPDTYQLLIGYLGHPALPIRELARWHLVRLAPAGRDIPYDAAAPEAQRQAAIGRWQTLIPPGRLPPRPQAVPSPK